MNAHPVIFVLDTLEWVRRRARLGSHPAVGRPGGARCACPARAGDVQRRVSPANDHRSTRSALQESSRMKCVIVCPSSRSPRCMRVAAKSPGLVDWVARLTNRPANEVLVIEAGAALLRRAEGPGRSHHSQFARDVDAERHWRRSGGAMMRSTACTSSSAAGGHFPTSTAMVALDAVLADWRCAGRSMKSWWPATWSWSGPGRPRWSTGCGPCTQRSSRATRMPSSGPGRDLRARSQRFELHLAWMQGSWAWPGWVSGQPAV